MANFEELLKEKEQLEERLEQIKKEFTESAKDVFKKWSQEIFAKYPPLNYITWTQYTPYFCDGDPCYFSSGHTYYSINTNECEGIEEEGFEPKQLEELQKEVDEFMHNFSDDDIERLFGDHCRVTITRNGVDVEEYDHD